MATDRLSMGAAAENLLGAFLKDRRARLDPRAFGFPGMRRRTPGLRREEVAQLADVSATWYTWLEQGRGGTPSADVLERLSRALGLTAAEREHLFLLALRRPPEVRYEPAASVTPRLQRIIDTLELCPAYVRTATWDILAWNRAAAAVGWVDYGVLGVEERNALRLMFCDPRARDAILNWEASARSSVAAFRADAARAGASHRANALAEELSLLSPEFAAIWRDNDVRTQGEGTKYIRHPIAGVIGMEYSAFAVDGQPDLGMLICSPATPADTERIRALVDAHAAASR